MPITVTHAKSDTIANYTGTITQFNSTGGTVTVAATDLVRPIDWNSAHAGTLAITGSEIGQSIQFANGLTSASDSSGITAGIQAVPFYEPFFGQNTNSTLSTQGAGTWYLDPLNLPHCLGSGQFNILAADAAGFKNGAVYRPAPPQRSRAIKRSKQFSRCGKSAPGPISPGSKAYGLRQDSILTTWALTVNSTTGGGGTTSGSASFPTLYHSHSPRNGIFPGG